MASPVITGSSPPVHNTDDSTQLLPQMPGFTCDWSPAQNSQHRCHASYRCISNCMDSRPQTNTGMIAMIAMIAEVRVVRVQGCSRIQVLLYVCIGLTMQPRRCGQM